MENNTQVQKNKNKDINEDDNLNQTYLKYILKTSIFKIVMHMYVILCCSSKLVSNKTNYLR